MNYKKAQEISELVQKKEEHDRFFNLLGDRRFQETTEVHVFLENGFLDFISVKVDTANLIGLIQEERKAIDYALEQAMERR